ncbi:DUF262 domain-containing protein [Methanococcoides seepicolus]|uniref:DUF262 domain-containing protein n=1 Tax=Methanococcoides seepicolus TaxID=2828780 RepID=A0A9E4ZCW5_9EURY|nr:DUF262 domain-containing protein [Methanococcoides seepicolus]MCM1985610.1 DUF262 domain-containing protein [Methanococcoides seepicolus]
MSNNVLNLYPIDYPFESLVQRVDKNKLKLDPHFQRVYKWNKDGEVKTSRFIESALMRIPLPACYFAEDDENNHLVIDGVQRITTIVRFFKDEFALKGLTAYKELNGKKFSELGKYKNELESYTIRCIILRNDNKQQLVQDIFARLNQGGVSLTPQEIRHALYPGNLDSLLSKLAQNTNISKFGLGKNGSRKKDGLQNEEQVLRFFAMKGDLSDYNGIMDKYLDVFMINNQHISDSDTALLQQRFCETLEKCIFVFKDDVFVDINKEKRRQSMAYYDLLMWSFEKLDFEFIKNHSDEIVEAFNSMCLIEDFQKTVYSGVQKKYAIIKRRKIWEEKLSGINE